MCGRRRDDHGSWNGASWEPSQVETDSRNTFEVSSLLIVLRIQTDFDFGAVFGSGGEWTAAVMRPPIFWQTAGL